MVYAAVRPVLYSLTVQYTLSRTPHPNTHRSRGCWRERVLIERNQRDPIGVASNAARLCGLLGRRPRRRLYCAGFQAQNRERLRVQQYGNADAESRGDLLCGPDRGRLAAFQSADFAPRQTRGRGEVALTPIPRLPEHGDSATEFPIAKLGQVALLSGTRPVIGRESTCPTSL